MQSTFADGIINISVTGPLVRIELGTASVVTNNEGKQDMVLSPCQQIVMPIEGFVRAVGAQDQIVRKLIADGILKMQTQPTDNKAQ